MPAFDRSATVGFSLNPINRLSEKRSDTLFVERRRQDAAALFFIFVGEIPVLHCVGNTWNALFDAKTLNGLGMPAAELFLGEDGHGRPTFAVQLDEDGARDVASRDDLETIDLRSIATRGLVDAAVLGELGGAKAVFSWHQRHGFCANCGAASTVVSAGWRRDCPACGTQHFPRVDPVVIMLAVDGDRCLLGRQPRFVSGMYSALAGFLEPGETIEDAVRREIQEEAGIRCGEVRYFASQPWPFPSSLMIACFAQATSREVIVDVTELEDARWFSRAEVASMLSGDHVDGLTAPQPFAIAHHLLTAFVNNDPADGLAFQPMAN